ncbi:MAG: hypothetical protein K6G24_13620 [Lachnospiraceae bacterium]|nr:hypothetical protein [Lachnospiraceae bacterium]
MITILKEEGYHGDTKKLWIISKLCTFMLLFTLFFDGIAFTQDVNAAAAPKLANPVYHNRFEKYFSTMRFDSEKYIPAVLTAYRKPSSLKILAGINLHKTPKICMSRDKSP